MKGDVMAVPTINAKEVYVKGWTPKPKSGQDGGPHLLVEMTLTVSAEQVNLEEMGAALAQGGPFELSLKPQQLSFGE